MLSRLTRVVAERAPSQAIHGPGPLWLARLQREDNWWLKAERLEQQGQLADARRLYLVDADRQLERGCHARVAVSCAASAGITMRLGNLSLARWEWERAAQHFRLHAERAAESSLREAAWAYEKAAGLYDAAGLPVEAAEMRRCATAFNLHIALPADGLDLPPICPRDVRERG